MVNATSSGVPPGGNGGRKRPKTNAAPRGRSSSSSHDSRASRREGAARDPADSLALAPSPSWSARLVKGAACVGVCLRLGAASSGSARRRAARGGAAKRRRAVGVCTLAPAARALLRWVAGRLQLTEAGSTRVARGSRFSCALFASVAAWVPPPCLARPLIALKRRRLALRRLASSAAAARRRWPRLVPVRSFSSNQPHPHGATLAQASAPPRALRYTQRDCNTLRHQRQPRRAAQLRRRGAQSPAAHASTHAPTRQHAPAAR